MEFVGSDGTNSWAEMRWGTCVFECKGCRKVAMLVQEVEDLKGRLWKPCRGWSQDWDWKKKEDRVARREEEKGNGVLTPDRCHYNGGF